LRLRKDEPLDCPEAENHRDQRADDNAADEVGDLLRRPAHVRDPEQQHVTGDGQREGVERDADRADREEKSGFVPAFTTAGTSLLRDVCAAPGQSTFERA